MRAQVPDAAAAGARVAVGVPPVAPDQVLLLQERRLRLSAVLLPGKAPAQAPTAAILSVHDPRLLDKHSRSFPSGRPHISKWCALGVVITQESLPSVCARAQFYNGFSGQSMVDDISAAAFNVLFTSVPILLFAVLDRPVHRIENLLRYPQVGLAHGNKPRRILSTC